MHLTRSDNGNDIRYDINLTFLYLRHGCNSRPYRENEGLICLVNVKPKNATFMKKEKHNKTHNTHQAS